MAPAIRAVLLLVAASLGARAAVLYKSVSPDGVVEFSDILPDKNRLVDRVQLSQDGIPTTTPHAAPGPPTDPVVDMDGAVASASAQLDLAEHALAEALRALGSPLQGMHLKAGTLGSAETARIDFYRRNVQLARQNLLEVLHARTQQVASR